MAGIVNLRQRRKQAARAAARKSGDENAARSGQPKPARERIEAQLELEARSLDNHRRERPDKDA